MPLCGSRRILPKAGASNGWPLEHNQMGARLVIILRVFGQILIAASVMILGYDALTAMETGAINPIRLDEFAALFAQRWGIAEGLEMESLMALAEDWPLFMRAGYVFVIASPAFFVVGVVGAAMALLFRSRA
ncbi:hypothetical protein JYU02_00670 [bacterium AH-315-P15]|nr:hypothetical protein [bacterium AH-315-P15]